MNHQIALSTQAVERYTLGELTSPEREAFEEHFFSCPDCAAALREFEAFAANARAVFREDELSATNQTTSPVASPARTGWKERLRDWFGIRTLIPASAVIAALVVALVMLRPQQPDPSGPAATWTLAPDVRDEVPHETVGKNAVWIEPTIDLLTSANQPNRWASYHWEIRDAAAGKVIASADGHDGRGQLTLKIPASTFDSGKAYRLTVQGDPSTSPESASFVIDRQ